MRWMSMDVFPVPDLRPSRKKESPMSHPRARRVATAALFGCCLLLGGCQSSGSFTALFTGGSQPGKDRPAATSVVIAQGMELEWQIKTTQDSPGLVKSGKGVVGPDGMLVLGP